MSRVKKEDNNGDEYINLNQDGRETWYRMKRSTQVMRLMNAYADHHHIEKSSLVFLFAGQRLRAEQTPNELEMEDGDEIHATQHLTG